MKPELAIVNSLTFGTLFPEHLNQLAKHFEIKNISVPADCSADDLLKQIKNSTAIIASVTPKFSAEVIAGMPKLKIIARHGIGYDSVDLEACNMHGVLVTRVLGELERVAVAEHAIALLMSAARHVPFAAKELTNRGNWSARKDCLGYEITGKTVGLIGHGNIGSRTAEILKAGFNCRVLVADPYADQAQLSKLGYEFVSLEQLCRESLIIMIHCNLNDSSKKLISAKEFDLMPAGVLIVNTARGEIVDEVALLRNLDSGKIFTYASDVIAGEPVDNTHHLVKHPRTLITPHIGNMTFESLRAMGESMVSHVLNYCLHNEIALEAINGDEIKKILINKGKTACA
jgi:phosphoglycerate dehydrogenase-like enzyme